MARSNSSGRGLPRKGEFSVNPDFREALYHLRSVNTPPVTKRMLLAYMDDPAHWVDRYCQELRKREPRKRELKEIQANFVRTLAAKPLLRKMVERAVKAARNL